MSTAPTASSSLPGKIYLPPEEPTRARRLRLAALVLVVLGALWMIGSLRLLPRRDTLRSPVPQVVIALGAGARDDSTLTSATATRLEAAIAYARAHNAGIVTTRVRGNRGEVSDRAQRVMISAAGLADRWIALPNHISNTRDEALAMHMVIPDSQPIAVVTSPMHTRRACATFEHVGYTVTCLAAAEPEWWRLPYLAAYETAAYLKYRMRGWL